MTTYNHSSSYNRTYERKVIEEGKPTVRILGATTSPFPTAIPGFPPATVGASSFITPHNYHFGTSTSGSFHSSDDSFSATLDVSAFAPEDLKVSVVGQHIVIEAKHPEKQDSLGLIERHFVRKFQLPKHVAADAVTSNLTADGQLTVYAEPPKPKENSPARSIPIKILPTGKDTAATENGTSSSHQGAQ
ncbi:Hsp20/alpha crystallin family protein [Aphelenchoides avenae]|nr:Hsp20/alpha crystallin family protein [Aphelenchus avenae]